MYHLTFFRFIFCFFPVWSLEIPCLHIQWYFDSDTCIRLDYFLFYFFALSVMNTNTQVIGEDNPKSNYS